MSIIGTRPPLISETNLYELHHRARLAIKPGITGMWQVSGRSDIADFEEVVRLDKEYITNWNIGLDIKILFKTILVVFKKDGSMQFPFCIDDSSNQDNVIIYHNITGTVINPMVLSFLMHQVTNIYVLSFEYTSCIFLYNTSFWKV